MLQKIKNSRWCHSCVYTRNEEIIIEYKLVRSNNDWIVIWFLSVVPLMNHFMLTKKGKFLQKKSESRSYLQKCKFFSFSEDMFLIQPVVLVSKVNQTRLWPSLSNEELKCGCIWNVIELYFQLIQNHASDMHVMFMTQTRRSILSQMDSKK